MNAPAPVIAARGLAKRYVVHDTPRDRLLNALVPSRRAGRREVRALAGVDFEVRRGESVAVIGRNGSGKSTLLQILSGTLSPTAGAVRTDGRVCALLELGSGFHPDYTGRENVVLNGLLLGLEREAVLARMDAIAAFAEIGEALDRPVKTYSSGMTMRLAFAVLAHADPDVLVIDEALAVGDFFFQQKCYRHIRALREKGVTLLFVSHDMGAVRDLCSRAILLEGGQVAFDGDALEAIRRYFMSGAGEGIAVAATPAVADASPAGLPGPVLWKAPAGREPAGEGAAILAVGLDDGEGNPALDAPLGSTVRVSVRYRVATREPVHVTVAVKNQRDQVVTATGSWPLRVAPPALAPGEEGLFELRLTLDLEAGPYGLGVSLGVPESTAGASGHILDETPWLGPLRVAFDYQGARPPFYGMAGLPARASFAAPDRS